MVARFLLLLIIAAGVGAWVQRDTPPVSGWLVQARALIGKAGDQTGALLPSGAGSGAGQAAGGHPGPAQAGAGSAPADAAGGLRKCVRGEAVLYTAGACPSGSTEKAMSNAQVSVVPALPKPAPAADPAAEPPQAGTGAGAAAGGNPLVRARAANEEASLRAKAIDRIVDR
ncbi:MAG: hypothetical protein KGQ67_14090 [Betaproteobacteria bacterium]|nr:hypothetical protein [Betaproteobacteria bacterium]